MRYFCMSDETAAREKFEKLLEKKNVKVSSYVKEILWSQYKKDFLALVRRPKQFKPPKNIKKPMRPP